MSKPPGRAPAALAGSLVLAFPVLAQAQLPAIPDSAYRRDQPEVLAAPRAKASEVAAVSQVAFAQAYVRAGRPTIAVLWNREFTDLLQQPGTLQIAVDSVHAGVGTALQAAGPGFGAAEVHGASVASTRLTVQSTKATQPVRLGPAEHVELQVRAAFMQTLAAAGVRLVDRNVVMRTTAARRSKGGGLDSQQIETEALERHATLLMEVLNTRDASAPTGWATHVSIKRLADGVVLTEGHMDGRAPEGAPTPPPRFEADPRGGFREVREPAKVADVGQRAAEQVLSRLAGALGR